MLKVFLASLELFYAVLIGDKSFYGFLDLFNAVLRIIKVFVFCSDLIDIFLQYLIYIYFFF